MASSPSPGRVPTSRTSASCSRSSTSASATASSRASAGTNAARAPRWARSCWGSTTTRGAYITWGWRRASATRGDASSLPTWNPTARPRSSITRGGTGLARASPMRPRGACRGRRAAGTRGRISRGSPCGRSSSSRWPTTTCRGGASATPHSSGGGARTRSRASAPTRSSRWFRRTSSRRSSRPGARGADPSLGRRTGRADPAGSASFLRRLGPPPAPPLARRVVVRVGRLLRWPHGLRNVPEVHPDARPGGRPAAHRVDEDVLDREPRGDVRMPRLPPLEAGEGGLSAGGVGDHQQRRPGARPFRDAPAARRRHAGGLALSLAIMRRPGRVSEARCLVSRGDFEELFERADGGIDPGVSIADLGEALRHRAHREIGRLARGHLVPGERGRYARVGQRSHRIRGAGRAILGVLVVVEKHAAPLLLPPLRGRERWCAPLDLARERERRAPDLGEGPARLDAHVHVHPARAARLGPAGETQLLEQGLHLHRDPAYVRPRQARPGIEIDPQLVGVLETGRAHGVRMKLDAAEIHDPSEAGGVVDDHLLGGTPGWKGKRHRPDPGGPLRGRALLVEGFAFGSVHEALEHDGTIADARECALRDGQVVADEIELREPTFPARKVELARMRDPHLSPLDREDLRRLFLGHAGEATP